jgi:hypothetical protein
MSTGAVVTVAAIAWCTALGLWLAAYQDRRYERRQLEHARTMPAHRLGEEPAVQAAEEIVYAAWLNTP